MQKVMYNMNSTTIRQFLIIPSWNQHNAYTIQIQCWKMFTVMFELLKMITQVGTSLFLYAG